MWVYGCADNEIIGRPCQLHRQLQKSSVSWLSTDTNEFRHFLRRLRKVFPEQAAEACLAYMATRGLDAAAQSMAYWLSVDHVYMAVLLDPDGLPPEVASKAIAVVKNVDLQFLSKFAKASAGTKIAACDLACLEPGACDRRFQHPHSVACAVCAPIRTSVSVLAPPNCSANCARTKGLIERQMQSDDPRVRSGAIEALWNSKTEDAKLIFRAALSDTHHRVVGNALVGLYLLGDTHVLNDMVELSGHKDHLFRGAMAWAMGYVRDTRAIPALQELVRDRSAMVRKRAAAGLVILEAALTPESATVSVPEPPAAPAFDAPAAESFESEAELNLFLFK